MTTALEQNRQILDRLARWSSVMDVPERRALHLAQTYQEAIDSALELHAPDTSGQCLEDGNDWPCPTVVRLGVDQTEAST